MSELKTKPTRASVANLLKSIEDDRLRADCRTIAGIMKKATKASPKIWGANIVGFGTYKMKCASGRELDWMRVAFAPRKGKITLYIRGGFDGYSELRARLGAHTGGKGCLHIKSLSDIHLPTLQKLVGASVKSLDRR